MLIVMNARSMFRASLVPLLGVALVSPRPVLPCCAATPLDRAEAASGDYCRCCEGISSTQASGVASSPTDDQSQPCDDDASHKCTDCMAPCCVKTPLTIPALRTSVPASAATRLVVLIAALPDKPPRDGVFHPPRLI